MFLVKNFTSRKEQSLHVGNSIFGFGMFGVQIFFFFFCEMDICHVKRIYSLEEIMKFFNQLCKQHICRTWKKKCKQTEILHKSSKY